jgi:hypothetical protein
VNVSAVFPVEEFMFTFANTRDAIEGEKKLLAAGLAAGVMPLPGRIGAGCGICLRVSSEELDRARAVPGFRFHEIYAVSLGEAQEPAPGKKAFTLWNP